MTNGISPTVVLVHGAFADASHWTPVIQELQTRDLPVLAPANPLRGLTHDAAYIASVVEQIDGPVLLVGHSYGGAVISVAAAAVEDVVGLVFVAAWILDEDESFADVAGSFPATPLGAALRPSAYPTEAGTAVELTVALEHYRAAFAADLSSADTATAAVSQRPWANVFDDRAPAAAWRSLPAWAVVATADNAIHPAAQRHMARRAGAEVVEVEASHSVALSQPRAVSRLILGAVDQTSAAATATG